MKTVHISSIILLFLFNSVAQSSIVGAINEKEVFWESDFNAALSKAKAKNQLLFVACFSYNCPIAAKSDVNDAKFGVLFSELE